jgi:hypothetical protein
VEPKGNVVIILDGSIDAGLQQLAPPEGAGERLDHGVV